MVRGCYLEEVGMYAGRQSSHAGIGCTIHGISHQQALSPAHSPKNQCNEDTHHAACALTSHTATLTINSPVQPQRNFTKPSLP